MKKEVKSLCALLLLTVLLGCDTKKGDTNLTFDSPLVKSSSDTIIAQPKVDVIKTVLGKVEEITTGKDGYTAKIVTDSGELFFVTISHSNLTDEKQFKVYKVGEQLEVSGIFWQIEKTNQIIVKTIIN